MSVPDGARLGVEQGRSAGWPVVVAAWAERDVINVLPGAVVVTDSAGGIVMWSASSEQLFGWRKSEVAGRRLFELLALSDVLTVTDQGLLDGAANGTMVERALTRRDGSSISVMTMNRPLIDGAGSVVAVVYWFDEAAALHRAEQQTRDLSEQLHAAVEAGGLGTWRWNLSTGEMIWDERLEALFGLPPGGFDGTFETFVSLVHPDDRELVVATIEDALARKSTYRIEHRVVWPDGSLHWHARVGGVTSTTTVT